MDTPLTMMNEENPARENPRVHNRVGVIGGARAGGMSLLGLTAAVAAIAGCHALPPAGLVRPWRKGEDDPATDEISKFDRLRLEEAATRRAQKEARQAERRRRTAEGQQRARGQSAPPTP